MITIWNDERKSLRWVAATASLLCTAVTTPHVLAQSANDGDVTDDTGGSARSVLMEEIVVTARKREERAQDAPVSMTALGAQQIEARKIRSLEDLTVGIPNVSFDDVGTTPGTANFSIRGLGINSSIPSIDPTVGTFVDGVYLGTNAGVVFDVFDLQSIEVLRGPQGTLFGRNVTGGAVLLNTKEPGDQFETTVQVAVEGGGPGGESNFLRASTGGPVTDTIGLKVAAYYNHDDGWFENRFDGENFGDREQFYIRPVMVWTPNDRTELIVRYEYTNIDGQGPAGQSHTNGLGIPGSPENFDRDSFDFSINTEGFVEVETHFVTSEFKIDVGESGQITNIFGYRNLEQDTVSDLDAQPASLFDARFQIESEQISNELRYSGEFGALGLVTGIYYFNNDVLYGEGRTIFGGALTQDGGGDYSVESTGVFISTDYLLNESWILETGLRYTYEEKAVQIASLPLNTNAPCGVVQGTCPFDFVDSANWNSLSPKIGFTYVPNDSVRLYGHWTRSFRSGGYNLRNSALNTAEFGPGPFDQEQVDNFEVGFKSDWSGGRLTAALFHNSIDDMQREVQLTDPTSGVVQLIRNTADARLIGAEAEGVFQVSDWFVLDVALGLLDAEYTSVFFDLNGDNVVDDSDKDLELPRAPELTYAIGVSREFDIRDWGVLSTRVNYSYRDDSIFTDNNLGFILEQEILNFSMDFQPNSGGWVFSLYGKNLLDSVLHGNDGQLPATLGPAPLGGTFAPLTQGQVIGAKFSVTF